MIQPDTRYATVGGGGRVAYQLLGDGPRDLVHGDGTLASFTSPEQAIECALGLGRALKELGLDIRTGLHAGLVELRGDGRLGGLAVHIGARVMALAGAGEVLVSHTVHGILIGSRYVFEERGQHQLKGVPGTWPLYAVGRGGVPT